MARQTRAERRARREARDQQGIAPARRPEVAPAGNVGATAAPERRPAAREPRSRLPLIRFTRESWGELQKVEWPTQNQVVQGTVVVLVACIIVGIYLWLCDEAFRRLVQQVFL